MSEQDPGQVRVLVVDDDHGFLRLMDGLLGKMSCRMAFCENGKQAVDFLRTHAVDICFMDIMMPEMNGIEAAQIIRDEISRVLPIIAVTSSAMQSSREKCLDVGMNDYIVKPADFEAIRAAVERYALKGI